MDTELRQELQIELNRLHESMQAARAEGYDQNDIEQATNLFEIEWLDRLVKEQRAEWRGAKAGVEQVFEERYDQADMDRRDAGKLAGMTPEGQIAFWSGNRTGDGVHREAQRAQQVTQSVTQAQKQISGDYNDLRYALVKSIKEIEAGRPPSLTRILAAAVEKDANAPDPYKAQAQVTPIEPEKSPVPRLSNRPAPETWQEYQAREAQKQPDQERSAQVTQRDQELEIQKELKRER